MLSYSHGAEQTSLILDVETIAYQSIPSGFRGETSYAFEPLFIANTSRSMVSVDLLVIQCMYEKADTAAKTGAPQYSVIAIQQKAGRKILRNNVGYSEDIKNLPSEITGIIEKLRTEIAEPLFNLAPRSGVQLGDITCNCWPSSKIVGNAAITLRFFNRGKEIFSTMEMRLPSLKDLPIAGYSDSEGVHMLFTPRSQPRSFLAR